MPDTIYRTGRTPPAPSGMRWRLELFVEDMDASMDFYTKVLGFEVLREQPGDYVSLRCGSVTLGIGPIAKMPEEDGYFTREIASLRWGLGTEIAQEIDAVNEWCRHVSGCGYPIFEASQDRSWGLRDFLNSRSRQLLSAPHRQSVNRSVRICRASFIIHRGA